MIVPPLHYVTDITVACGLPKPTIPSIVIA